MFWKEMIIRGANVSPVFSKVSRQGVCDLSSDPFQSERFFLFLWRSCNLGAEGGAREAPLHRMEIKVLLFLVGV